MKKIISLAVVTALSFGLVGCSQKFTHVDKQKSISSLDFTKYQKKDFLITPGEYGDNYTAMGIFTFTVYPEANYLKTHSQNPPYKWVTKNISSQEVLDLAYETAIKKGANAITHFKIRVTNKILNDGIQNFSVSGLEMSGLLIKRNN
jgi:hypothetical protein